MKLQAKSSSELNKALQKSAKCIKAKNFLPVLNNALLTVRGEQFYLTTSTGDAQLTVPVPFSLVDGKLAEPLAIPVNLIMPFLATLPDCTVTFTFEEQTAALHMEYCTSGGGKTKEGKVSLTYSDGKEFPIFSPLKADPTHIAIPMETLDKVTKGCADFVSNNELRPQMCCLCIDIAEDLADVSFVATNGQMLYRHTHTNNPNTGGSNFYRSGAPGTILIHSGNFRTFTAFDGCEAVDVESDGGMVRLSTPDGIELVCKSVEQRYPNYKAIIPKGNPNYICFDRKEMLATLKRVSIFSDKTANLMTLTKSGMFLDVAVKDVEYSRSAEDQVTIAESSCAEGFCIGFNVAVLTSALNAIDGDTVRFGFSDPSHATVFTEDTPSPSTLALCMPMLVQ